MLGMGLNAQAQEDKRLFFFGFEDGMASFTDSTNPLDSITKIRYYAGTPTSSGWDIVYEKDSVMYILNGVQPLGSRNDSYEIITDDEEGGHAKEFERMGAEGGKKYFKYIAGDASSEAQDYNADLFIRGVKIEDNTSYRLVYYVKATSTGKMYTDLMRGFYNSEKPLSLSGASGNEFRLHKTEFMDNQWERVTMMSYYQNDSVAERHMWNAGYWWTNSWSTVDPATNTEYQHIEQFDKYFVRLSFSGPNATYYVDDIALYKSWIGGAESNGYIIRVNFGYDTNLAELAKASEFKAIELPGEYFEVTGIELDSDGEPVSDKPGPILVESGEYHSDGYLYLWLEDECQYYKDLRVKFINPEDPKLQLKYNGSLYPMGLDSAWVNAGKIVPNFEDEFVVPNPRVFATSIAMLAPVLKTTVPENGSFNLPSDTREIKMYLTKKPYIDMENNTESSQKNVVCVVKAAGVKEYWLADPQSWDENEKTLVFKRQAKYTAPLKGDYSFTLENAKATATSTPGDPHTVNLSFGDLTGGAPEFYYQSQAEWTKAEIANESLPLGWTRQDASTGENPVEGTGQKLSSCSRIYYFNDGGQFTRGMYLCPRGTSVDAIFKYGEVSGYPLHLKAGDYWLSFSAFGWDGKTETFAYVYPLGAEEKGDNKLAFTPENQEANGTAKANYTVNIATSYRMSFSVAEEGDYVVEFFIPKSANWGATVIGAIELSNQYSAAYKYLQNLIDAQTSAAAKVKVAEETSAKYSGAVLTALKDVLAKYETFKSTSPSEYNAVTKEINDANVALQNHMTLVDKFYSEYAASEAKRDEYAGDSAEEKGLAAYAALLAKIKEYESMDPTTKTDDEIKAITAEMTAATKAVADRVNNNAAFVAALNAVKALIDDEENVLYAEFAEFVNAQKVYNAEKDDNLITISDEELAAATKALTSAKNQFNGKVTGVQAMTVQIKALAELAEALEVDFDALKAGSAADIKAQVASVTEDDQNLANAMKAAIKYTIYKKIAEGELDLSADSLDVTPFITNYNLYTTASDGVDMEKFYYSYSAPNDRWRVKTGKFETIFPGWTVQGKGGNFHIGSETLNWKSEEKAPVFDAYIGLDWNSSCVVTGTVDGLPIGKYSIGIGANAQKDGSMLIATVGEVSDTALVAAASSDLPSSANTFVYGVELTEGQVALNYTASTGSGWSRVDNFAAILTGVVDVDYSALVDAAKAAAIEELNGVDAIDEVSSVKYYNINGVQTAQPKGVTIKVTTGKNGKVNAQKVLVK